LAEWATVRGTACRQLFTRAGCPGTVGDRLERSRQEFYFGDDFLLRRHDYRVDVAGGFAAIQYVYDVVEADGIKLPSKRRAYRCDDTGRLIADHLMVSIDVSEISLM
jgi:hypothetical protein